MTTKEYFSIIHKQCYLNLYLYVEELLLLFCSGVKQNFYFILLFKNNDKMDINELLFLGLNKYGQAGIGQKYHNKTFTIPKSFAFPTFIKQISCGSHHSAMLTIDGNIYTMGSNIHGALGSNANLNYSFVPTFVQGLNEVTKIDCGPFHMCAISNGQLYSWGKGIDGQLGHGNTKNLSKPMKIQGISGFVHEVSCGTNHTLVLAESGKGDNYRFCVAFGNGIYGQLGSGQSKNSYFPTKVKLDNIESIAAGQNHSLFISKGRVFACGDNSNGQVGTVLNKKFLTEPTQVQIDGNVKLIQAKKYSLALTDSGDMYIWGLKSNFGQPKMIKSNEKCEQQVIDIRIGNDHIYGLAGEGTLYSWEVRNVEVKGNNLVSKKETVLSNGRAILDFSAGDNHLLILGDIVKQIPYSSVPPSVLSCYDDLESIIETNRRQESMYSQTQQNESEYIESRIFQESREPKSYIDSKFSDVDFMQSQQDSQFDDRSQGLRHFSKEKIPSKLSDEAKPYCLQQKKDFNNLKDSFTKQKQDFSMQQKLRYLVNKKIREDQNTKNRQSQEYNDTFELIKTPSSSILCEPSNFLKESTRKQNYQIRKATIYDQSGFDNEAGSHEHSFAKKKKKYSYSYLQDKENMQSQKSPAQGKKVKKIDRIIELIEKSNSISVRQSQNNINICEERQDTDSQLLKSNRILRIQLRQKQLKISNLQQLLSRKQMEIEAQRQIIKALREKNKRDFQTEKSES